MEEEEVATAAEAGRGLVRVSSLNVRNVVLHDLTAAEDEDDDAIRNRSKDRTTER